MNTLKAEGEPYYPIPRLVNNTLYKKVPGIGGKLRDNFCRTPGNL